MALSNVIVYKWPKSREQVYTRDGHEPCVHQSSKPQFMNLNLPHRPGDVGASQWVNGLCLILPKKKWGRKCLPHPPEMSWDEEAAPDPWQKGRGGFKPICSEIRQNTIQAAQNKSRETRDSLLVAKRNEELALEAKCGRWPTAKWDIRDNSCP